MDTEDRTVSKDTTTSIPEETDAENSSTEIVAVADVHVDPPVVEDTEILYNWLIWHVLKLVFFSKK